MMAVARTDIAEPGGVAAGPRIITECIRPPVPSRQFDWTAYRDGDEEGLVGFGPTEEAAIRELQELIEENQS